MFSDLVSELLGLNHTVDIVKGFFTLNVEPRFMSKCLLFGEVRFRYILPTWAVSPHGLTLLL